MPLASAWPPAGILVGTLLLSARRRWVRLIACAVAAMILSGALHGEALLRAASLAVLTAGEATGAAWLMLRLADGPFTLARIAHTAALIVAALVIPVFGGFCAALIAGTSTTSILVAWRSWALAEAIGILGAAPVVMSVIAERPRLRDLVRSWKTLEFVLVFATTIVVAGTIFSNRLDPLISVPAYVLPFLLWPAFRFGPGGTAATLLAVTLLGIWNAAQGRGPIAINDAPAAEIVLRSQGAAVVAAISLLLLASVVAERRRVAQENANLIVELQQALAEVKTLRGFIPICAWCHKVRDDAGFWQQIEKYLDARTDATFSHSICPSCSAETDTELRSHDAAPPPAV
jgi:integral membrane sensor domain MASE1